MKNGDLLPAELLAALVPWREAPRWLLGFSGGLDSTVLLHLLSQLAHEHELPPLLAVHIDHQLQLASFAWRDHCRRECEALGIEFVCLAVNVGKKPRVSPEDAARKARYEAFASVMKPGDVLLLAHHADDQAETFLLRALRGAGVAGLAATPRSREFAGGNIVRPLLDIQRDVLERYAATHRIEYVQDPSNDATGFDRNFLRHEVFPRLKQRWPQAVGRFSVASQHMAEANVLLRERGREDLACCNVEQRWGAPSIELAPLALLSSERQRNACRVFFETALQSAPLTLSQQQLRQLQLQWFHSREDADPTIEVDGIQLRRYRGRGFILRALPKAHSVHWQIQKNECLEIPGIGQLKAKRGSGGMRLLDAVDIRFRQGGELWFSRGGISQPLKQWFQENAVPPWWRDHLPLLYQGNQLIAIVGFDIAPSYRTPSGEEGWQLEFVPAQN